MAPSDLQTMSLGEFSFMPFHSEHNVVIEPSCSRRQTRRHAQPATISRPWRSKVRPSAL